MTDKNKLNDADDTATEEAICVQPKDVLIEYLVSLSEIKDLRIGVPITIFLKGIIISGNIISLDKYMDQTASNFRTSINGPNVDPETANVVTESIAKAFDKMRAIWVPSGSPREMIHLENIKLIASDGKQVPINNGLWRGPIAAIDGFIIGTWMPQKPG